MLIYVHGFNSSPASRTLHMLREACGSVHALAYSCAASYADNFSLLLRQLGHAPQMEGESQVLVGSSLGGFYAARLAAAAHLPVVCLNPCLAPQEELRPFVGSNTLMHSGIVWDFTAEACASYAQATDPRTADVPRCVVLGMRDSLLNPVRAREYWQGHARLYILPEEEHSLSHIDASLRQLLRDAVRDGLHVCWD